jgi:hypothetical protein
MWTEVFDDDAPAVVWLFSGQTNAPDDVDRWLLSMERLDRATAGRAAVGLLVIDDGNPPPPADRRERITALARSIRGDAPLAVVTSSSIARAVVAGVNLTGVVGFALRGFADVEAACAWLAQQRPTQRPEHLRALVDEARARAARAAQRG